MKKLFKKLLIIAAVVLISGCEEQTMEVGKSAPDIAVKDAKGQFIDLDTYQDKPVLLEFLSKTCGSCLASIPKLNEMRTKNPEKLGIIAIATDIEEGKLNAFAKEYSINYPLVADQLGITQERYQVIGFPTMIYLDRQHKVVKIEQGLTTNPNWIAETSAWIEGQF